MRRLSPQQQETLRKRVMAAVRDGMGTAEAVRVQAGLRVELLPCCPLARRVCYVVHEYTYWSDRLVNSLIDSNTPRRAHRWQAGLNAGVASAQVSNADAIESKAAQARRLNKILKKHIVRPHAECLNPKYLAGATRIIVSSLQSGAQRGDGVVNLFTQFESATGKQVAVCLFGSRTNVIGQDTQVPPWRMYGWTSSTNPGVDLIVNASSIVSTAKSTAAAWSNITPWPGQDATREVCSNALNISIGQGSYKDDTPQPWHRGYTLGHDDSADWLARIYYTAADVTVPEHTFDIVHVGTPIWVRTTTPSPWTPYTVDQIPYLDAQQHPKWLQRLALRWYQRKGRHLRHHPPNRTGRW